MEIVDKLSYIFFFTLWVFLSQLNSVCCKIVQFWKSCSWVLHYCCFDAFFLLFCRYNYNHLFGTFLFSPEYFFSNSINQNLIVVFAFYFQKDFLMYFSSEKIFLDHGFLSCQRSVINHMKLFFKIFWNDNSLVQFTRCERS